MFFYASETGFSQYTQTGRDQYPWHETATLESVSPLRDMPTQDTAEEAVLDDILGPTQPGESLASENAWNQLASEVTCTAAQVAGAPAAVLDAQEAAVDRVADFVWYSQKAAAPDVELSEAEAGGARLNADDATKAGEQHAESRVK